PFASVENANDAIFNAGALNLHRLQAKDIEQARGVESGRKSLHFATLHRCLLLHSVVCFSPFQQADIGVAPSLSNEKKANAAWYVASLLKFLVYQRLTAFFFLVWSEIFRYGVPSSPTDEGIGNCRAWAVSSSPLYTLPRRCQYRQTPSKGLGTSLNSKPN